MNFLLDTNVVSEATRLQPSTAVLDWIAAQEPEALFISVMTLGELRLGALLLAKGRKREGLLQWIENGIEADFAGRILTVDTEVMKHWAKLQAASGRAGRRLPVADSILAATALAHNLTVATRNTGDFEAAGVPLLDPWRKARG